MTMRLLITGGSGFIGTNLVEFYSRKGVTLLNLDWNPPLDTAQKPTWRECDIMDQPTVRRHFEEFKPTHVVHLAARADTDEPHDINAYIQNHEGTRREALLLELSFRVVSGVDGDERRLSVFAETA